MIGFYILRKEIIRDTELYKKDLTEMVVKNKRGNVAKRTDTFRRLQNWMQQ